MQTIYRSSNTSFHDTLNVSDVRNHMWQVQCFKMYWRSTYHNCNKYWWLEIKCKCINKISIQYNYVLHIPMFEIFVHAKVQYLTHWGRVTHICVSKLTINGSDNVLSPCRCQAIIWTNAVLLLIRTVEINFSESWSEVHTFSFMKMRLEVPSGKWQPFCLGLNVLMILHLYDMV